MHNIQASELHNITGGTGDEEDWVDNTAAFIRNLARGTRGFLNGFFGGDNCHCY